MPCVGPKSGAGGKYLSHSLKSQAMKRGRESLKENPAFNWVKMEAKKSPVLSKHPKAVGKGGRNLPTNAEASDLKKQGLE